MLNLGQNRKKIALSGIAREKFILLPPTEGKVFQNSSSPLCLSLKTPWFGGSWHRRAKRVGALSMDLRLHWRSGFRQGLHHNGRALPQGQGQHKEWAYRARTQGCWEDTRGCPSGWHLLGSLGKPGLTFLWGLPHQPSHGEWFAGSGTHPKSMGELQEEPENTCMWSHGLKLSIRPCKAQCKKWLSWPGFTGLNCGLLPVISIKTFQHFRLHRMPRPGLGLGYFFRTAWVLRFKKWAVQHNQKAAAP